MHTRDKINEAKSNYIHREYRKKLYRIPSYITGLSEDLWVPTRLLESTMSKYGWTLMRYINEIFYGVSDENWRPKCKNEDCNNLVGYMLDCNEYHDFCCVNCMHKWKSSKEYRESARQKAYAQWDDPNSYCNSDEYKKRLSQIRKDTYKRLGKDYAKMVARGLITHARSDENRKSKSERWRDEWNDPNSFRNSLEYRKMLSEKAIRQLQEQHGIGFNDYLEVTKCDNHTKLRYKSGHEWAYIIELELNSKVSSYSWEFIKVPYTLPDGSYHNYLPDVLVYYTDGRIELQEIKPYNLLNDPTVQAKASAAIKYCKERGWTYRFITEDDIYNEESLKLIEEYRKLHETESQDTNSVED